MVSSYRKNSFINYPEPIQGPDVPYKDERKSSPRMTGWVLGIGAFLLVWVRFIAAHAWHNAGFSIIRKIFTHIEHYEPWVEPIVVPLPSSSDANVATKSITDGPDKVQAPSETPASFKFPKTRYYSVADYHALYLSGEITPTQVAKALLPLIRRDTEPRGAHADSWVDTKVDIVLRAAEASTKRYKNGCPLGPLDGVPTGVKDEYELPEYSTWLGMKDTMPIGEVEDGSVTSWCVRKLEEAGVVILGKLAMVELGLDTPGNNPVWGTPRNPYNPGYYTGGSSSGSGYAVAAGLIPFALGSDGGGSIRIPASFCSVFGLKPTHARLSTRPGINYSASCACLGPLAADIRSLAAVHSVIAQPHPSSAFPPVPSPLTLLTSSPSRPKILGIVEAWFAKATPSVRRLCHDMIDTLEQSYGYTVVPIHIPFLVEGQVAHAMTVLTDAATLVPDASNLTPTTQILVALGNVTPARDFLLAQKLRSLLMHHLSYLWKKHPGMIIMTPTTACAGWPIRSKAELSWGVSDADRTLESMQYVWLANLCGLPSLTVPAGYVIPEGREGAGDIAGSEVEGGVPVGLMATGEWASEANLLQYGLDAEEIGAGMRRRPGIWEDVVKMARSEE